ncbi:MAG TPA: isoprenyl transferase [Chthoniobacterales bacterium]
MSTSKTKFPRHVAVIMDGNGRWARERGLPRLSGHREGAKTVQRIIDACVQTGIQFLTLYAFSRENWKRPQLEISGLMRLLVQFLGDRHEEMMVKNIRFRAIGRLSDLPEKTLAAVRRAESETAGNTGLTLVLALSYGGRTEIVDAVNSLLAERKPGDNTPVTEESLRAHLYTADFPDPDLLIRTSGEMRISNFLLWQISYAEIFVTKKLWPDFSTQDFLDAVSDFGQRERRFGGI